MGNEARWNNSKHPCCSADTIDSAISTLLSLTNGKGFIYVYELNGSGKELVKKVFIK